MQKKQEKSTSQIFGTEEECPKCFGNVKKGQKCPDCSYNSACRFFKYSNEALESGNRQALYFREFDDAKKIRVVESKSKKTVFQLPDGEEIQPSKINMSLIIWALNFGSEHPNTAKAFAISLSGGKNISDIAMFNGRSRQAERRAIASELGLGKKKVPESKILSLSDREFLVYQCCLKGMSRREAAKTLKINVTQIQRCVQNLRRKGLGMCTQAKSVR